MEPREFAAAPQRRHHGFVIAALLAVLGLWLLILAPAGIPDRQAIGAGALVLSAGMVVFTLRSQPKGTKLRIDSDGVWFDEWGLTVPWSQVFEIVTSGSRIQAYISLRLIDAEGFVAALPEAERNKLKGNRLFKVPEFRIPNAAVDASMEELLSCLREAKAAAEKS